jgi:predicted lipoprotein with Yx(FWY)xxD motif
MTATSAATAAVTKTPSVGATSVATSPVSAGVTVSVTKNPTLGMILVDGSGMTLYQFKKDSPNKSACTGACATAWPPLTVTVGTRPTASPAVTGTLTVITRTDGSNQVAYNAIPLYHYAKDNKPGDTNGQGVGSVWFVVWITSTNMITP